jgi:hypothetical protein
LRLRLPSALHQAPTDRLDELDWIRALVGRKPRADRGADNRGARHLVRLHDAAVAIAALPLENVDADDAVGATRRLTEPIPPGSIRVVLVHEGHLVVVTSSTAPGCLAVR